VFSSKSKIWPTQGFERCSAGCYARKDRPRGQNSGSFRLADFVASVLHLPPLVEQAANYFRLAGLLVGGLGMLYIVTGRLSAEGFVFASMLDRPLVPLAMAILWYLNIIPGPLTLIFSIQDFGSFLWTLKTWNTD
jgi:hypothetical protein